MVPKRGINIDRADLKQMKRINAIAKLSAKLFGLKGYLETSMDDIAAAAKVTKGGVYHYFPSKTEILYFICSTYVDLDLEGLEQSLRGFQKSAEKIKFIVFRHINHYTTHTTAAKTLLNEAYNLPPKYLREVRARERRYLEIVSGVISEFLGTKSSKGLATILAFTLFGMMNWIYSWYDPKGTVKPEELSQLIYEIFTSGISNSILK
ncbi:MAG: TetR/AcrR family transcriptional regulator [Thermodesulfobacteriota bacterium]|jgi:AcrR family transcriptional regulator